MEESLLKLANTEKSLKRHYEKSTANRFTYLGTYMGNLKQEFEKVAKEEIECAVIGIDWDNDYDVPKDKQNIMLPWSEAAPFIDREYNNSYGVSECNPVTAWTKNKVLWVYKYDGSTGIAWAPRNPIDHKPSFSGISFED